MFTGIVQELGSVNSLLKNESGFTLEVSVQEGFSDGLLIGASIAVNGCCLTVTEFDENSISFDVIKETIRVTNLEYLEIADKVNLERSLKYGDEVGGHILSGHVSCGAEAILKKLEGETELVMKCPAEWRKYILLKGYVAVNGASLTVAKVSQDNFSVFLIPETLASTNLSLIKDKDQVNIEIDQTTMAAFKAAET
jgi:riboflavin synthase|tara:strand:- start:1624 stop:2211 length:588 start_codon:yes stop_codon:yes gene_type:complete